MAKEIAKSLLDIEAVTLSPNDLYTEFRHQISYLL